jgi:4'-phosphopantetheinyl transferase
MTLAPADFDAAGRRLRWQPLATGDRAQDLAGAWLRDVAGEAVAGGLHRDPGGRPRLPRGDTGWSHTHGRLLIAYAEHGRVGVDVERRARRADTLRIARRYFADEETAALAALDGDARQLAFLRLWCAKEAVLKAHGGGIAFGLHRVVFDAGGDALRMLRCDRDLGDADAWALHELAPEPGFLAVLAARD